jgi:uncharacterized protein (DUF1501 family)
MKETRREFLKKAGAGLGAVTMASQLGYLGMLDAMANPVGGSYKDYKAMVLVFLAGGNDGNNMVVPKDTTSFSTYGTYSTARGDLTIPKSALLDIHPPSQNNESYGLHQSLAPLLPIWDKGKMAIVANVGNLVEPMTRAEYQNNSKIKPLQLFSHADQIEQNQTAISTSAVDNKGWGGRISDKINSLANPSAAIPMITSIAGAQIFSIGDAVPLSVGDASMPLSSLFSFKHSEIGHTSIPTAFELLASTTPGPTPSRLVTNANEITRKALDASVALTDVTTNVAFPATGIGRQLEQAARMIQLSTTTSGLDINRQIFFCQLGGFDTHAYQLGTHAALLSQLATAVGAFYDEMQALKVGEQVTTFTMSDFGRTLKANGTGAAVGSDHAWGNHALVIGDAVNGGDFFGVPNPIDNAPFPRLELNQNCDLDDRGRWIPTTSTTEYGAALVRWFAELEGSDMVDVFPHYPAFNQFPRCNYMNILVPADCF